MKVLTLIPDCLENPMGGMGEQGFQILKRLDKDIGWTVIGSPSQEKTIYSDNKNFLPFENISLPLGNPRKEFLLFLMQANLTGLAATLPKPDLIHAFDWTTFYAGYILSNLWNIPLVVTIQLSYSQMYEKERDEVSQFIMGIELLGLEKAAKIIQVSHSYARGFAAAFLNKTTVINNGIDLKEWEEKIDYKLPGKNRLKVIFIGRLAYQKGIQTLIQASIPNEIDLIYIGGGRGGNSELQDAIIQESQEKENIFYLGPLYGRAKIGALQAASAVIMPSVHEPFGIVALEALASKSILLSSFVNGMGDFLTEDIAINCGTDSKTIENALNKLILMSKEERDIRVNKGVNLCKQFDWDIITKQVENVYKEVLENAKVT